MTAFKLVKSETCLVTRELAEEFANMQPAPTEREVKTARLRMLETKAMAGVLVTFHWAKAKFNGSFVRVNGQHSSLVLSQLTGDFPEGLMAHVDTYEVDDLAGLGTLFHQFDDPKSSRSANDHSGAWQGLEPALTGVPRSVAKLGIDGITWRAREIEGVVIPGFRYAQFSNVNYHPFLLWIGEVFTVKTPELRKPAIVAAMYDTFNANQTEAREFWESVARGGPEFEENAPQTVLDNWLKKPKTGDDELKPGNYYQACIHAWNAFREGVSLRNVKYDTKKGMAKVAS